MPTSLHVAKATFGLHLWYYSDFRITRQNSGGRKKLHQAGVTDQEAWVSDRSLFTASSQVYVSRKSQRWTKKRRKGRAKTPSRMPQPALIKADTIPHLQKQPRPGKLILFWAFSFTHFEASNPKHFTSCCYTSHQRLKDVFTASKANRGGVWAAATSSRDLSCLLMKCLRKRTPFTPFFCNISK